MPFCYLPSDTGMPPPGPAGTTTNRKHIRTCRLVPEWLFVGFNSFLVDGEVKERGSGAVGLWSAGVRAWDLVMRYCPQLIIKAAAAQLWLRIWTHRPFVRSADRLGALSDEGHSALATFDQSHIHVYNYIYKKTCFVFPRPSAASGTQQQFKANAGRPIV